MMIRRRRPWPPIAALLALAATIGLGLGCGSSKSAQGVSRPVPEYFARDASSTCVYEITFSYPINSARLLQFVDSLYARTNMWRRELTLAGVDYVDSKRVFAIAYSSCNASQSFQAAIPSDLHPSISVSSAGQRSFVSTLGFLRGTKGILDVFHRFKPKESIQNCLASVSINGTRDYVSVYSELWHLIRHYRFPIMDIGATDQNLHLLFSNFCSQRATIFERLLQAADREKLPLRLQLGPPDFTSGAQEYVTQHQK
jgi:hypothetical protein